jgi:5-formyltetrahydrofolate cyclo-ligase
MASQSSSSSTPDKSEEALVRIQKQELRKKIRLAMKGLSQQQVEEQSAMVWNQVVELPIYQKAQTVGLFLSMPQGEIQTDVILKDCVLRGKDIYVPEVGKNFELCDMELRKVILNATTTNTPAMEDGLFHKTWPKNKWAIPEPPADMPFIAAKPGDLDLVIMPGLAFDRSKNRLGQGKGYYDRFIARMTQDGHTLPLLAVALRPQLVEDAMIPVASYDKKMDIIALPDEVIGN